MTTQQQLTKKLKSKPADTKKSKNKEALKKLSKKAQPAKKKAAKPIAAKPVFTTKSNEAIAKNVIVKKSPIHGKGAFAKRKIRKGSYIGSYEGITVLEDNTHVLWVQQDHGGWHLIDGKNDLRFVNHSSKPNAEWDESDLYALKTIQEGDEITFHYGDEWEGVD